MNRSLRGEYFNDDNQLKMFGTAPAGGSIFATTLSANFKTGGFIFIPEFRMDNATENVFVDKDGAGKKLLVNVNRFNKAIRFYERHGYKKIKEEDIELGNGVKQEDFVFEKNL